ncbi:MAG: cytochrome c biogenesis protein CcsA, partial [Armatimonadota bacterium]|nr:cytochrome c biogenesis protein CcsA [Armatimonadota bacterium]
MNELGNTALLVAFSVSLYGVAAPLVGARTGREELVQSGENAVVANFFLLSLATAALLYALLTRDFRNTYVASYTSRDLSFWYTVSALWAGQAGSLLFWTWLLSAFATISVRINREWLSDLMPYAMAVMMATSAFFLFLLSFASSPFELLPFRPADGQGLNPLLQNPGMFFHPPTLYLGYVGFTVPYAFAIAALVT